MSNIKLKQPSGGSLTLMADDRSTDDVFNVDNILTGYKNLLINGGFDVWQRGDTTTGQYMPTADRWNNFHSTTTSKMSDMNGNYIECSGASADSNILVQCIELLGTGISKFKIGTILTVSFEVASTSKTKISMEYRDGLVGANPIDLSNNFEGYKGSQNDVFEKLSFTFIVDNNAAATSETLLLLIQAEEVAITKLRNIQLEIGSVATNFDQRPIGLELSLCQRYYQDININRAAVGTGAQINYASTLLNTMRTSPTLTYTYISGDTGGWSIVDNNGSVLNIYKDVGDHPFSHFNIKLDAEF